MKTQTIAQTNIFRTLSLFSLFMILMLGSNTITAQTERIVKGIISDEVGPLERATVILKGTNIGVDTDEKGAFTFPQKLKENDTLVVIMLGYKNKEVTVGPNTTFLNVTLTDYDIIIVGSLMIGNNDTVTKQPNN